MLYVNIRLSKIFVKIGSVIGYNIIKEVGMGEIISAIGANIGTLHIILFAAGIICLIVEMFEPGFGVFGGAGIVLMIVDVFVLADTFAQAVVLFLGVAMVVLFFVLLFFILASCGVLPKKLVLDTAAIDSSAIPSAPVSVGDIGTAVTRLAPSGKAEFGSLTVDIVSDGEFIEKGQAVRVTEVSGNRIVVCSVK